MVFIIAQIAQLELAVVVVPGVLVEHAQPETVAGRLAAGGWLPSVAEPAHHLELTVIAHHGVPLPVGVVVELPVPLLVLVAHRALAPDHHFRTLDFGRERHAFFWFSCLGNCWQTRTDANFRSIHSAETWSVS